MYYEVTEHPAAHTYVDESGYVDLHIRDSGCTWCCDAMCEATVASGIV